MALNKGWFWGKNCVKMDEFTVYLLINFGANHYTFTDSLHNGQFQPAALVILLQF